MKTYPACTKDITFDLEIIILAYYYNDINSIYHSQEMQKQKELLYAVEMVRIVINWLPM